MASGGRMGKTTSAEVPMPAKRSAGIAAVTGEPAGSKFRYRITQDVTDAHGGVDLLLISEDGKRTWASEATWEENSDPARNVWDLLIARLKPVERESAPRSPAGK